MFCNVWFGKGMELEMELAAEVKPIELQKRYRCFWNADTEPVSKVPMTLGSAPQKVPKTGKNCPKTTVFGGFWHIFAVFLQLLGG